MISSYGAVNHREVALKIAEAIKAGNIEDTTALEACTNVTDCGGLNKAGRAIIHHALRECGFVFFLADYEEVVFGENVGDPYGLRSQVRAGIEKRTVISEMERGAGYTVHFLAFGRTLNHAAHKLGNGNSKRGWRIFNEAAAQSAFMDMIFED